jgi:hypothetical protein
MIPNISNIIAILIRSLEGLFFLYRSYNILPNMGVIIKRWDNITIIVLFIYYIVLYNKCLVS